MGNESMRTLGQVFGQIHGQEADEDVDTLLKAACGSYIYSVIRLKDLQKLVTQMEHLTSGMAEDAEIGGTEAEELVLWIQSVAADVEMEREPLDTVIQRAAEFLHDYWSDII